MRIDRLPGEPARGQARCAWLVALLLAFVALPLRAEIVVSNLTVPVRDFNTISATDWAAQSFDTDAQAYELSRVAALVGAESGMSGAFVEVRTATPTGEMDTSPGGLVGTLVPPDLTGPRSARDFLPAAPIPLAASTRYFVLFGATGPGTFEWSYAEGNASTGVATLGPYQYSFDGGGLWSIFGSENPFHLEVESAPVDEFVLVSNVTEPVRSYNTIDASLWAAQSFETDPQTYALTSIRTLVGDEVGSSGAFAELRASLPTGEMDTSPAGLIDTLVVPDLTGPRALRTFLPTAPIPLAPSTRYHLLLGASGPGSFEWSYAEGNGQMGPGTLSQYQYTFDGGGLWSIFGSENPFHVEVRALPEPGLGWMIAFGLAAIAARERGRRSSAGRSGENRTDQFTE
ncbi:MAG: choice-of-anchor R domain-containing protein [Myxococcota bacterium]